MLLLTTALLIARLLLAFFSLALVPPPINRTWRILEIKLAQLAPDLLNLFDCSDGAHGSSPSQ
jgi:hypothetical protein